jgi:sigma-54 dependent transcriptional regulator, acetoin dehydrogenase operon transcriptional activator AcoR
LGDSQPRHVCVRLLALTNRNLPQEVEAGRFRRDLYHRISVARLRIPPLRERDADIELLTGYFNRRLAQRHGLPEKQFSARAMALLRAYPWPGNVRELRNVIETLVLTCVETEVAVEDLPAEILQASPQGAATNAAPSVVDAAASLDDCEQLAIQRALQSSRGNLTQAARALGVSRSTLYRKIERYQLAALVR